MLRCTRSAASVSPLRPGGKSRQCEPDFCLSRVLNDVHVLPCRWPSEPLDESEKIVRSLSIRGHLSGDVSQVGGHVASRIRPGREHVAKPIKSRLPGRNDFQVSDQHAFLCQIR